MSQESNIFVCLADGCTQSTFNKATLKRHQYDLHTMEVLIRIKEVKHAIKREQRGFACPVCLKTLKTTSTFKIHVNDLHEGTMQIFNAKSLNVKRKSEFSSPTLKLPKVCSKDEIKTAIDTLKENDILTNDLATIAAMSAMGSDTIDQQRLLLMTEMMNAHPIALTSTDKRQYYLLGSSSTIKELASSQPSVNFIIPLLQQNTITENVIGKKNLLDYIISNSPLSRLLKNEIYWEINQETLEMANHDWRTNPQSRYGVSQLFAGCILLDGTNALLVNCIETYGRKKDVDPHAERYSKGEQYNSLPACDDIYESVCTRSIYNDESNKLIIGTFSCNMLITSSCTIEENPKISVGPSTNSFQPSKQTRIYLHEKSIKKARLLLKEDKCDRLYTYDLLEQVKQIRSKFYRTETYSRCRCSSEYTKGHIYQPYTVFTLFFYDSNQTEDSAAKRASEIFNRIATEVHTSTKHDRRPVLNKNTLEWFIGKSGDIADIVNCIARLFETSDEIEIIGNMKLDEQLKLLAKLCSTPIKTANDTVIGRLVQKLILNCD
ncbi:hypothetical protein J3Q64DRAFT_1818359 [Phycomyces blakesleeanus]